MNAMTSPAIATPPTGTRARPTRPSPVHETIATARQSSKLSDEMNSLKDKVAIITGAVGNLGTATARAFQQSGAKTVLVDRSPDRMSSVFADISKSKDHLLERLGAQDTAVKSAHQTPKQTIVPEMAAFA